LSFTREKTNQSRKSKKPSKKDFAPILEETFNISHFDKEFLKALTQD
jgi:hypothetical protein